MFGRKLEILMAEKATFINRLEVWLFLILHLCPQVPPPPPGAALKQGNCAAKSVDSRGNLDRQLPGIFAMYSGFYCSSCISMKQTAKRCLCHKTTRPYEQKEDKRDQHHGDKCEQRSALTISVRRIF